MAKRKTEYNPRLTKKINNLSRAFNKIDKNLYESTRGMDVYIGKVKTGINTITYETMQGEKTVRYDEIYKLSLDEQASLSRTLSEERYKLRTERALEQLKTKGKISWQFKRSLEEDNPELLKSIENLDQALKLNEPETIKDAFTEATSKMNEFDSWQDEAQSYFDYDRMGGDFLFAFYQPGKNSGFDQLNEFTWNAFKVIEGL